MSNHTSPQPVDFSHHLNRKTKARHPSPLKDLIRYMGLDGMISLAGGSGAGNVNLLTQCRALTEKVYSQPGEYDCPLHLGNINARAKVVGLLCEDDDFVIVEEYTYPSAHALWIPLGIRAVPVPADAEGIRATALRELMEGRGGRGIYLVSVGSNPTGIPISRERRKEIYEVCVEFDIIIVEDDPYYYFLQYPSYMPSTTKTTNPNEFTPSPPTAS